MSSFEEWLNQEFKERGFRIEEATLLPEVGLDYWHSTILDKSNFPISGGFASTKTQARKIAISEFLERKAFYEASSLSEDERKRWGLNVIPTACGFAAGFDKINTVLRALSEACERWVMSKWIDDGFYIEEIPACEIVLDPISHFFAKQFVEVKYYKKSVEVFFQGKFVKIEVAQTMGLTEHGIFPGSSAQINDGSIWQHSLLESYRHLLVVKNNTVGNDKFPGNKVLFFSNNKDIALLQIAKADKKEWPMPEVILEKVESKHHAECFIARIVLKGWKSWHLGPIERFLY
jgi:hypothetical protein